MSKHTTPNYFWSIFTMKCPRCRRGNMYNKSNPWKFKQIFSMPEKCPVCSQKYELEMGFWYGTGYVSYALSVALSVSSFVAWWVLIGMSTQDTRFFWWLGSNIALLLVLQPWLMRLSRVIYLYFFVSYTDEFDTAPTKEFDNG